MEKICEHKRPEENHEYGKAQWISYCKIGRFSFLSAGKKNRMMYLRKYTTNVLQPEIHSKRDDGSDSLRCSFRIRQFEVLTVRSQRLNCAWKLQVLINTNDYSFLRHTKKHKVNYVKDIRLSVERNERHLLRVTYHILLMNVNKEKILKFNSIKVVRCRKGFTNAFSLWIYITGDHRPLSLTLSKIYKYKLDLTNEGKDETQCGRDSPLVCAESIQHRLQENVGRMNGSSPARRAMYYYNHRTRQWWFILCINLPTDVYFRVRDSQSNPPT